ncbi:unnamed protein product [Pedinophyceae sp. YPF-701]|nr:unnamed protein product [Pedinophyceae sp. YPF-701]
MAAYVDSLAGRVHGRDELLSSLRELHAARLWHQLTDALETVVEDEAFQQDGLLAGMWDDFIAGFALKLNPLRCARIGVKMAGSFAAPAQAMEFVQKIKDKLSSDKGRKHPIDDCLLYLDMNIALLQLQRGETQACRDAVDDGTVRLGRLSEPDPTVSASVHWAASQYHKSRKDFAEFFRSAMQYLSSVPYESLAPMVRLPLAVDVALAALLGEGVFNFGEILLHPIIKELESGQYKWLGDMLKCFNNGDLHEYDALCRREAAALNAQPALVANERALREKVTILSLLVLIFETPAEKRTIPLETIARGAKLDTEGVEQLLMRCLSLGLIKGTIDQVGGVVQVTWVQPRVLTLPQLAQMQERLGTWLGKVEAAAANLESAVVVE